MEFGVPLTDLPRRPSSLTRNCLPLDRETMLLEQLDGFIAALLA